MREIKFRGREKESNKWVFGYARHWKCCYGDEWHIQGENDNVHIVMPETVGQFTGLKDPTGKEIYEGDILECLALDDGPFVVRVVFRNGAFHTDVHDGVNGADFTCLLADFIALGDVRIVGNIWDGYPKFVSNEGIEVFEK
jgi:hypothetical protein